MKTIWTLAAVSAVTMLTSACATTDNYASQCERDYAENQRYATASGAALGALAGGLLGNQLSERDDPCGYGFCGYNRDGRYGYDRVPRRGSYGYY